MTVGAGLAIVDSACEIFRDTKPYKQNPILLSLLNSLLRPYHCTVAEERLVAGSNLDYATMAVHLMDRLQARGSLEGTDLVVLAHYLPNLHPLRITTSHLMHKYGLRGTAFALSEREDAIAYVALKVIRQYLRSRQYRRAVLLVMDQNTIPYDSPDFASIKPENCGVALVLELSSGDGQKRFLENSTESLAERDLGTTLNDRLEDIIRRHGLARDRLSVIANARWYNRWENRNGYDCRILVTNEEYLSASPFITYFTGKCGDDNIIFFHLDTDFKLHKAVLMSGKRSEMVNDHGRSMH
jgi:hypothetical protein